jgi:hypothetical protein
MGDPTDDPDVQNNKENAEFDDWRHGPHWLHDPLGLPFPQLSQITAHVRLEQEDHKYQ